MIRTNKEKLLTLAAQGMVAPAQLVRAYATTWDGKPKMAIGTGGINYNLRVWDKVFGWACGDRATVGVSTEGIGEANFKTGYLNNISIGNDVRVLDGDAKGGKGVVIGKFGQYIQIHFEDETLQKLSIGDSVHVIANGVGLKIEGYEDVVTHSINADVLEKMDIREIDGKLEVPVVKVIPEEIVGQGSGGTSLSGNWHIQTCYPPDIHDYGLGELRFGDVVLLENFQSDYGRGYYRGGATVGVICSGPSDISGLGIGVTPILSTRKSILMARVDHDANIGKYLDIKKRTTSIGSSYMSSIIKTNKDQLITIAVQGVVQPFSSRGYSTTYDGRPKLSVGMASINYTVSLGDSTYGWANADHVEPDVTIQGRDKPIPSDCALAILACIGNEAKVVSGEAKGDKGYFIGRHAGSDDLVWFPKETLQKLTINDKIQIMARGVGLKIEGFDDVRVNKLAPELLENMGITIEDGQLVVPVVLEVPGHIMGSGIGGSFIEPGDYDIQTTCNEVIDEYNIKNLKLGDIVAIKDHYDYWGRGRYKGAITIGTVIHGFSDSAGHGPGVDPILSAFPGKIKTKIDPNANTAYYLGIRKKPN
jgi:hypothetical protein